MQVLYRASHCIQWINVRTSLLIYSTCIACLCVCKLSVQVVVIIINNMDIGDADARSFLFLPQFVVHHDFSIKISLAGLHFTDSICLRVHIYLCREWCWWRMRRKTFTISVTILPLLWTDRKYNNNNNSRIVGNISWSEVTCQLWFHSIVISHSFYTPFVLHHSPFPFPHFLFILTRLIANLLNRTL